MESAVSTSTKTLTNQHGFTLLEALVATTILAMISLSFAIGADRATRYNVYAQSLTAATTLAHDKVEQLEQKASTDAELTAGAHADTITPMNPAGTAGGLYTRTWTVTNDTPVTGLKTVEVRVVWSLFGDSHTVRLVLVHA
jgi:prepilin-type N-terminal cleavage/methylation domain-containing protein